ncbi:MAG: hypothetical protein DSM107014_08295 [Gomphosphaeria aponina SAG 52.96 = DSM 107014]|uniref:O-GlcNAc transferase C-terminal domain-containing protein n=1 Tax=Gomphosphaeria aponina SAG 52.96 = DSM 107014 TaxID=1521640 RepID=A0A941GQ97_9CHRO|nr:hypothetical protein [Gomphosphaeria aponina SAG 52.96 = DSM 107014]
MVVKQKPKTLYDTDYNLWVIELEIKLGSFTPKRLNEWQVREVLQESLAEEVDSEKLLQVLAKVGEFPAKETVDFAAASLRHTDAVVYLSAQAGLKRHPDHVRLQLQIIKAVPNSYLLIKGLANEAVMEEFFTHLAEAEGVSPARLRFLPRDATEAVHRANLSIADVVLDTYPYNGATTTLEVLWLGIPLVTRVGEQFAARNSYAFMMNVGLTEGIAWTDSEYVAWGIKLGLDAALREKIAWKLRAARRTSPLWNGREFTREMEKAYQQMWAHYCSKE